MCVSCGCGQPNESHGDPNNITLDMVERAASSAGIDPQGVVTNIQTSLRPPGEGATREHPNPTDADDEPVVTEAHGSVM